jgi:hypothetical protein
VAAAHRRLGAPGPRPRAAAEVRRCRVTLEPDPAAALRLVAARAEPDEEAVVVPTYTAMLELRAVAERAGAVGAYWAREQ